MIVSKLAMEFSELGWSEAERPRERMRRVLQRVVGHEAVETLSLERMTLAELLYYALAGEGAEA
jgi:hypothetical protein